MKIISINTNGIRAAARKGFFEWMHAQDADFICIQETKAQMVDLTDEIFRPDNYHLFYHDAVKKGYSGTAIYSKHEPLQSSVGLGWDCPDNEGRYVQLDFDKFSVASIYIPSGSSKDERQLVKYDFMDRYEKQLEAMVKSGRDVVICGDWNIVHKEIDIKNWKGNQKNSGCLPEERAWLDKVFGPLGMHDAFRLVNQEADQYTWWSNRGRAWDNNVGWRIDYQVVTAEMAKTVKSASIYKEQRFSDHSPLIIEYDYCL